MKENGRFGYVATALATISIGMFGLLWSNISALDKRVDDHKIISAHAGSGEAVAGLRVEITSLRSEIVALSKIVDSRSSENVITEKIAGIVYRLERLDKRIERLEGVFRERNDFPRHPQQ